MKISRCTNSRIQTTDFKNLKFGTVFSDHMLICRYEYGKWGEVEIRPYGPIEMNPGTQILHYGQAVFEGMKAFKNDKDEVLVFRKEENFKRLNKSAIRLSIPEIPRDVFMNGLNNLLSLDSQWCSKEEGYSLYIRPFIFASGECIKASSSEEFTFIIITSPTTKYYPGEINVVIEEHYTRAARGGVGSVKAAGNYAASFYPTKQANAKGFQQVIWTDAEHHKFIEESGTMNIWFRIGDKLITPSLSDSILGGITRDSVITLAKDNGIVVEERRILVSEIIQSYNNGNLKESFGTGTAVAVTPINSITFKEERITIPSQKDSFAIMLKKQLQGIQKGKIDDKYNWNSLVS
ncbi:MAG: branched chain amino acid aminotransferase [Flavobacteriales bacterium]|nr:branched chain amino acid aminotransferase [Flavobacteriales bacterium]|tara:strand:- start:2596 stop:3642 length:1047 start_codon:yes stop_codon:yes gene_type:complete